MAKLQVGEAANDYQWLPDLLILDKPGDIVTKDPAQFVYTNNRGDTVTVEGAGFTYSGNKATGGTISTLTVTNGDDEVLLTITELNSPLKAFVAKILDGNSYAAIARLMQGDDEQTGSEGGDIPGGFSPGDDIVDGKGGGDFIMGDPGNDTYSGGGGGFFDTLSYSITVYANSGKRGVDLDAAKGTAIDPWGDTDTFSGLRGFRGSRLDDKLVGSKQDEDFSGVKGDDLLNGKGGWDVAEYSWDFEYPGKDGKKGIKVDMAKGKVIDGWGDTDTLLNIETVRGTQYNDEFLGSKKMNQFEGLGGKDFFDGKGGFDFLNFGANDWAPQPGKKGVIVNVGTGKVIEDGYGNKESFANIESFIGTRFGDKFIGDDGFNEFKGEGGNDIMTGKGGGDTFVFNPPPDTKKNHDIITDFNQKEGDHMALYTRDGFPELDDSDGSLNKSEFVANKGGNPTNANHRVAYDTETGKVWWVPQGNQSDERELIVTLKDAPKITHEAFDVWT